MKKTLTLLWTAAALLAASSSCSKSERDIREPETPSAESVESVKVNISVSGLTPDTKAIKKGWESGDIINVYLDNYCGARSDLIPDFTLTYDGSSWKASDLKAEATARLKASGTLKGFWEASNSCFGSGDRWYIYYFESNETMRGTQIRWPDSDKRTTTGVTSYLLALCNNVAYTYSENTLSASITDWKFATTMQVVVTGLPEGNYSLRGNNGYSIASMNNIYVGPNEIFCEAYSNEGWISGISNTDGIAFVGMLFGGEDNKEQRSFILKNNTTGQEYIYTSGEVKLTSENKTKVVGVKIPFSKFTVEFGTEELPGFTF